MLDWGNDIPVLSWLEYFPCASTKRGVKVERALENTSLENENSLMYEQANLSQLCLDTHSFIYYLGNITPRFSL